MIAPRNAPIRGMEGGSLVRGTAITELLPKNRAISDIAINRGVSLDRFSRQRGEFSALGKVFTQPKLKLAGKEIEEGKAFSYASREVAKQEGLKVRASTGGIAVKVEPENFARAIQKKKLGYQFSQVPEQKPNNVPSLLGQEIPHPSALTIGIAKRNNNGII